MLSLVDSMQTVKVTWDEEFSDREPGRLSPFKTGRIAFNILDLEAWQTLSMQRHAGSDSVLLVVDGEGMMFIDNDSFSLEPGEAVYVPAGAGYGMLAGDNDMIVIASRGPLPIETEMIRGKEYRCPACDLETPVPARVVTDNAETMCPRCEARLRLKKEADRLIATEIGPPAFVVTEKETAAQGTMSAGPAGEETTVKGGNGKEIVGMEIEQAWEPVWEASGEQAVSGKEEQDQVARIAFSAFTFEPWQVLPMHKNPDSDTILYVASGQGIMYLDDEEQSVDAGTALYVPAGATYGLLAGDYDMIAVAIQCPVPVESQTFENLGYNCPVCDLGTPVTTNTFSGCVTVCPRCNIKIKLTKLDDGFEAEETTEPAPASAETT